MYLMNYMYLWLLLLPIAVYLGYVWLRKQDSFKNIGNKETLLKLINFSSVRANLKMFIVCLALFFIVIALLRPQWGMRNENIERKGLDIIFVLDVSESMFAEDIQPNRLAKAIYEINMLIRQLRGDRVALVTFAGSATPVCPLTIDYGAVEMFLKTLKYYREPIPGTNLEAAYNTAAELFDYKATQSKVIILFTDGENHKGNLERIKAEAGAKGVVVVPVAIGTTAGQPVPAISIEGERQGYKKDKKNQIVISHVDLASLQKIASLGPYIIDSSQVSVLNILNELKNLKTAKIKDTRIALYQEKYQLFLFLGLIFLVLGYCLNEYEEKIDVK